jgi:alpha,alpha-trehalase
MHTATPVPPDIDEYALLSDTHTAALVAPDGTVEWMCVPTFDAGSVFASLLDRQRGGALRLDVAGAGASRRRYLDDTLVLETRYDTPDGGVTVLDFLALGDDPDAPADRLAAEHLLVRLVRARGPVELRVRVEARPDYARDRPDWYPAGSGCWKHTGPRMWVTTEQPLRLAGEILDGSFRLAAGDSFALVLGYSDSDARRIDPAEAEQLLKQTRQVWQSWSSRSDYQGIGRPQVRRSALLLRALAFDETGALLAAPTTSLPEEIGGERNWDYRFTWYRDAAMLMLALFRVGHGAEGARYLKFLLHACAADPDAPPPVVGINGEHESEETELRHLAGYHDSRPVRIGNDAFSQLQLDTYGHLLDAALAYQQLTGSLQDDEWRLLRRYVDRAAERWREPDHGIWEIRGPRRHYVNSKVMAWVCLDRGTRLARLLDDRDAPVRRWEQTADEVRREVLTHGYDADRGAFVLAYGSPALDASLLRIPMVGFLPGDDPRVTSTIDRIATELTVAGTPLVYRYDHRRVDDGLSGGEAAFLLCSFELVSALVLAGRQEQARQAYDWLCERAGPLGLFAEQMDAHGRALGNYPQALTHLGLIEAAVNLDAAEAAGATEALHSWAADRGRADRRP